MASLVAQLVKNAPSTEETPVLSLDWEDPLEEDTGDIGGQRGKTFGEGIATSLVFLDFLGGSDGKEPSCSVEELGSIPRLGRSPGGGHGNPLQYSCLETPHGQRSLTHIYGDHTVKPYFFPFEFSQITLLVKYI